MKKVISFIFIGILLCLYYDNVTGAAVPKGYYVPNTDVPPETITERPGWIVSKSTI